MRIHRHRRFQKPKFAVAEYRVNAQIQAPEVMLIDENDEMLGKMTADEALKIGAERGIDVIEVSPKAVPPVCRLGDFGQFKYQKEKEARKKRAQSKEVEIKGIRLSVRIGTGDLDIRVKQAAKFFEQGDKIKVEIILRGREKAHQDIAREVFNTFIEKLGAHYPVKVESPLKSQDGRMHMILTRS
jgi:translation initiation factor IF-3